jgi:hypothetical protein
MPLKKNKIIASIVAALVAVKTILLFPYFTDGDLLVYNDVYGLVNNSNIIDGYLTYTANINSAEFVHYLILWISSNTHLPRVMFLSIFNALLAYLAFGFLYNNRNHLMVSILLIFNVYADIFYLSAERLKFSIILLILALQFKSAIIKILIVTCAIATHVQSVLVMLLFNTIKIHSVSFRSLNGHNLKNFIIIGFAILAVGLSQLTDHAMSKVAGYNSDYGGQIPYKTLLMSIALVCVAPKKLGALLASLMSIMIAIYIGDGRINFILYYILLIVCIRGVGNIKHGLALLLVSYGAYQDISFIQNVLSLGTGFKEDGGI